ncbi:hypothetical protein F5Y16DRAFT_404298 [Xylariaceae sp. FL0255]|nr:hypothetical protein F5Y16DRAFT_404298 [Xylariaceae sp. FL0255]
MLNTFDLSVPLVDILDVSTKLQRPSDPFGSVTEGHLILRGFIRFICIKRKRFMENFEYPIETLDDCISQKSAEGYSATANVEQSEGPADTSEKFYPKVEIYFDWDIPMPDDPDASFDVKCFFLFLTREFGLLLKEVGTATYIRLGFVFGPEKEAKKKANAEIRGPSSRGDMDPAIFTSGEDNKLHTRETLETT